MSLISALLCVLATALAVSASPAGPQLVVGPQVHSRNVRISGGGDATLGDYPYQVALTAGDKFLGAGVIISPNTVLTAAQCIDGIQGVIQVHAGLVKLDGKATQVRDVAPEARLVHPNFDIMFLDNDIALLTLPYPLDVTDTVNSIALPKYSDTGAALAGKVEVTGWGKTKADSSEDTTNNLQYAELSLVDNDQCVSEYGARVIGTKLCAAGTAGASTCVGDMGGPVTQTTGRGTHVKVTLLGLVSLSSMKGCGVDKPVLFTRVSAFYDFIEKNSDVKIADV